MTIDYLPWNRPAVLADRVCMRDTNAELTYAEVARRVDAVAGQFAAAGVGRGDVALLIYMSGSTGLPKGVMLDYANLAAMAASIGEAITTAIHIAPELPKNAVGKIDKPTLRASHG